MAIRQTRPLYQGNSKLGIAIWQWSVPANDDICVGSTEACAEACYAKKGFYRFSSLQESLERRYELSLREDFASRVISQIREDGISIVRVHTSGDFYSPEYVKKWITIVGKCPRTTFYAYTRSWRSRKELTQLKKLAALPNFQMWFSSDLDTGAPPKVPGVRVAYMKGDEYEIPFPVDLVFRIARKSVEKRINDVIVCPAENGATSMTCSRCQLCFNENRFVKLDQPRVHNLEPVG